MAIKKILQYSRLYIRDEFVVFRVNLFGCVVLAGLGINACMYIVPGFIATESLSRT